MQNKNYHYGRKLSPSEEAYLQKLKQQTQNPNPNHSIAIISSIIAVFAMVGCTASMGSSPDYAGVDVAKKDADIARLHDEVKALQEQINAQEKSKEKIEKVEAGSVGDDIKSAQSSEKILHDVLNVVDGETLKVSVNGKAEVVRIIGINTPETVDPRKPVECYGKEASAKAKELLTGKKVSLEEDVTQGNLDKYNRLLRFVFLEDGTNYGAYMIREGYAYEYTYNTPYKYQELYKNAEKEAKEQKRGLWADDACAEPEVKKETSAVSTPTTPPPVKTEAPAPKSAYTCNCSKTCPQMSSCDEAQYQLNVCGCTKRDADDDGVACDSDCE